MSTVLVVDDSDATHELVRRVLERDGHATLHASDAFEALHLLRGVHVDAVVADIVMPDIDGIQMAQLIRSQPDIDKSLPLVFYSAFVETTRARERVPAVQPATIVPKDGDIGQLALAVRTAIDAPAVGKDDTVRPEVEVVMRFGNNLLAVRVVRNRQTVYQLRRGNSVLAETSTVIEIIKRAVAYQNEEDSDTTGA